MMLKKQTVWLLTMLSLVVVLSVYYVTSPEGGTSNLVMSEKDQEVSDSDVAKEKQPVDEELPSEEEQPAKEKQPEEEKQPADESKDGKDDDKGESKDKAEADPNEGEVNTEEYQDGTVISSLSSDELFAELRMDLGDERSERLEELESVLSSSDATVDEISDAKDEMEALEDAAHKEEILETLIKSQGYDDALVRADGDNVKITVKAKDHDASSANKILRLVSDEMANIKDAVVTFQQ